MDIIQTTTENMVGPHTSAVQQKKAPSWWNEDRSYTIGKTVIQEVAERANTTELLT